MSGAGRYDALRDTEQQVEAERLARAEELVKSVEARSNPQQEQVVEQSEPTSSSKGFEPVVDYETSFKARQEEAAELLKRGYHPTVINNMLDKKEQGIPDYEAKPLPPPPSQSYDQKLDRAVELLERAGERAQQQTPEQEQGIER